MDKTDMRLLLEALEIQRGILLDIHSAVLAGRVDLRLRAHERGELGWH